MEIDLMIEEIDFINGSRVHRLLFRRLYNRSDSKWRIAGWFVSAGMREGGRKKEKEGERQKEEGEKVSKEEGGK